MKRPFLAVVAAIPLLLGGMTVSAAPVTEIRHTETVTVTDGVCLEKIAAVVDGLDESMYVLTAPGDAYAFEIGGEVSGKSLVTDAVPLTLDDGEQVVAAVNGDHFSFATGIPMGMSISDGRLITSPIEAYNADDYYFHAMGITADGEVLTGENPTLNAVCTIGGQEMTIERINRTRENWEGGQICLFTPDYGDATGTDVMGVEAVVRVKDGVVGAGQTLSGVIERVADGNDTPIEDGTVVLSVHLLRDETELLVEGTEVSMSFSFEDERWNDVVFAVGGNLTIVDDGKPLPFDYTIGAFTSSQPRSAIGVREDGTLVMAAVDGRSDVSKGLTANNMAQMMAESFGCTHAILLDGGGSTAMATADAAGTRQTVNVPSEQRPVGNTVLLVRKAPTPDAPAAQEAPAEDTIPVWWGLTAVAAAVIVCGLAVVLAVRQKAPKDGKND